jgi:hypothetical protein
MQCLSVLTFMLTFNVLSPPAEDVAIIATAGTTET